MRAVMFHNSRYVTGDGDSRSLYVGDIVEGAVAAEMIAAGAAEEISEAPVVVAEAPAEAPVKESGKGAKPAKEEAS